MAAETANALNGLEARLATIVGVFLGIVLALIAIVALAKLAVVALPAVIVIWFVLLILRGMVRTLLR